MIRRLIDEEKQIQTLDQLIKDRKRNQSWFAKLACRLGWHKWTYPSHNATRTCATCFSHEGQTPEGEWVEI